METLYIIMCHIAVVAAIAAAIYTYKGVSDPDSRVLSMSFMVVVLMLLVRLISIYTNTPYIPGVTFNTLLVNLLMVTTYALYPMRKLFPRQLASWRVMLLYLPFALALFIVYVTSMTTYVEQCEYRLITQVNYTSLHSVIALRHTLLLFIVLISLAPIVTCLIRYQVRIVRLNSIMVLFPAMFAVLQFVSEEPPLAAMVAYCLWVLIYIFINIYELDVNYLGLESSDDRAANLAQTQNQRSQGVKAQRGARSKIESKVIAKEASLSRIAVRLEQCMTVDEPWRNPTLKLQELAAMVSSNRTTLSEVIREIGFATFSEYVAHYRVKAFCEYARHNEVLSVSDLLAQVGFNSNSAAFGHFKRITGLTPKGFIESLNTPPNRL